MSRKRAEVRTGAGDGPREVEAWYRRRLDEPPVFPWASTPWEPVRIGPTWQTRNGRWLLPDASLGWDVLAWCGTELQHGRGRPWRFTLEQARFILWWYAVDERGRFLSRDGVLQRLKGWGKDPVGACLLYVEAFGPCRVEGMEHDRPLPTDCSEAWVQTAAVSLEQTKNTMRLMPSLITPEAKAHFRIQVGKELIHGDDDTRLIQAVTSSPATLEGARATFVLKNETQHWLASNEGHGMADVIERNASKSPGGAARTLAITNAYEPSEDSCAQHDREAWEKAEAGSLTTGILYDSLEAPPLALLSAEAAPGVVASIRGDSTWLDIDRIVQSILDTRNPPSRSRRFWYNQITAVEDAWVSPQEWDACADPAFEVAVGSTVTLGFDGSLTDDHSALIGCHVEADHLFEIGIWEPDKQTGEVDRRSIDRAVRTAFEMFDVVGFYADLHPFESYVDLWAEDFGGGLIVKAGPRQSVAWDMRSRTAQFTAACERLNAAIVETAVTYCGSRKFRLHALNARRAPNKWGISVRKEHRESSRKIDAVPAAVLARLARLDFLALPESRRRPKTRSGVVW